MTTLPALPLPQSAERKLAQLLLNESGIGQDSKPRLAIEQSTSGDWNLSASSDLKSEAIENALNEAERDEMFYIPSEELDIMPLIAELKATTSKPPWMDPGDAVMWEQGLRKAMTSYPIDVVSVGCKRWRMVPERGGWWPTEQDLRSQCEIIFRPRKALFNKARMLLQDLRIREDAEKRAKDTSPFASDAGREFRNIMRKRMNARRFETYFHSSETSFVGTNEIICRSQTAARILNEEGGDVAAKLGLTIRYAPQAFLKERTPSWEDDTPEERAETERKFTRLTQALRNGEDIKRLRKEGVL